MYYLTFIRLAQRSLIQPPTIRYIEAHGFPSSAQQRRYYCSKYSNNDKLLASSHQRSSL